MGFVPGTDYTNGPSNLPGTQPGTPPNGLPAEWRNATVVKDGQRLLSGYTFAGGFQTKPNLTTASQMLLQFDTAQADAAQTEALQSLLWKGGFYGTGKATFTPGERDDETRKAFIQAMEEASRAGKPFGDFLDQRATARTAALGDNTGRAPFSPTVSNPLDIRATLQAAASKVLGQDLPPDKLEAFVNEFQAQQVAAQKGNYDTQATGGTTTAAPDVSSFALDAAKRSDPIKADSRTAVQVASVIEKMMSGGTNG